LTLFFHAIVVSAGIALLLVCACVGVAVMAAWPQ